MRHILVLISATLISTIATAKCFNNGINFLSRNRVLNRNGQLILLFYGTSENLIKDLNKKYPIYLHSTTSNDTLSVIEVLKGGFRTTEVILKPNKLLKENENYEFKIDSLPEYERMSFNYINKSGKDTSVIFTTTNNIDKELPVLKETPVETKKSMIMWGCGPAISVSFKMSGEDKSEFFVRASVKNEKTGEITDYILTIDDGQVSIGHGMCSGAFDLYEGGNYEVSFCLIDQSGNKTSFTKPIHFTAPTDTDTEENPRKKIKS